MVAKVEVKKILDSPPQNVSSAVKVLFVVSVDLILSIFFSFLAEYDHSLNSAT